MFIRAADNLDSILLKLNLLLLGARITGRATKEIGRKFKENNYGYNNPNSPCKSQKVKAPPFRKFPAEITVGDEVIAFRYKENSPFEIDAEDDSRFTLKLNDVKSFEMNIPLRPLFWKYTTTDGIQMSRIGGVYGLDCLIFFLVSHCEFFDKGIQCAFCNLVPTQAMIGNVLLNRQINQIRETISLVKEKDKNIAYCNLVSGSFIDHDNELSIYIHALSSISDELPKRRLNGFVITMPPRNKVLLDKLYEVGADRVKMNLEIWDKRLWPLLLPGKRLFGYERFLDALKYAVTVFGDGNVASNIILGIDQPEKALEGIEFLSRHGIVPEVPILHIDPWTEIDKFVSPTRAMEYPYLRVYETFAEMLKKYGLKPILSSKSLRSSLSWEAYNGLLKHKVDD